MSYKKERQFGGLLAAIAILVFTAAGAMNSPLGLTILAVSLCIILVMVGFFPSMLSRPLCYWMKFGRKIGAITSPLALAAVFYLLFLPLGLFMRLAPRHLLFKFKLDRDAESYWIDRETKPEPMTRQF